MCGYLTALQDDLGVNKVLLDAAKLTVRGISDDRRLHQFSGFVSAPENTEALGEICQSTPFFLLVDSHTVLASTNASIMFALSTVPTHLSKHIGRWSYYCSANVTYVVIRDIIPNDEKKFLHESLLSHVRSSEEFSFCPTLDRQLAYRTGV